MTNEKKKLEKECGVSVHGKKLTKKQISIRRLQVTSSFSVYKHNLCIFILLLTASIFLKKSLSAISASIPAQMHGALPSFS